MHLRDLFHYLPTPQPDRGGEALSRYVGLRSCDGPEPTRLPATIHRSRASSARKLEIDVARRKNDRLQVPVLTNPSRVKVGAPAVGPPQAGR